MTDIQAQARELLHGGGEPLIGFSGSVLDAEKEAIEFGRRKPFCLVRDWRLIEVEVDSGYRASLEQDGLAPFVLYAHQVVMHSRGKRQPGDWVRSTFQRSLTSGYLFESVNTVYVLLGPGVGTKGSGEAVLLIGR